MREVRNKYHAFKAMLKSLPPIIATLIAIGATFIAGYIIFLRSQQSAIRINIEQEAFKMVNNYYEIEKQKSFTLLSGETKRYYLNLNPELSRIDILEKLKIQLSHLDLQIEAEKSKKIFETWFRGERFYKGRTYIYIIQESLEILFGYGLSKGCSFPFDSSEQKKREGKKQYFPYGPLNMEGWIENADRIRNLLCFGSQRNKGYTLTLHKIQIFFDDQAAFCNTLRKCRRSFLTA